MQITAILLIALYISILIFSRFASILFHYVSKYCTFWIFNIDFPMILLQNRSMLAFKCLNHMESGNCDCLNSNNPQITECPFFMIPVLCSRAATLHTERLTRSLHGPLLAVITPHKHWELNVGTECGVYYSVSWGNEMTTC